MLKRTPLFAVHEELGARLVDFGGWEMPVQYTSIMEEHKAVREAAGLFDISHMGEVAVVGSAASAFLNYVLTNDVDKLGDREGQYTQFCNERGGVIDDLYVYRIGPGSYILVINASRIEVDTAWLALAAEPFAQLGDEVLNVLDESDSWAALALQGPQAGACLELCGGELFAAFGPAGRVSDLVKNQMAAFKWGDEKSLILVSRTGYTGEDGFEILCAPDAIVGIWNRLLEVGAALGVKPCGLGARDTLRTEVCYPLYGHELDDNTTPIEAGIGWSVSLDKGDFMGRETIARQKEEGVVRRLIAFKMTGKSAPPRPGYAIWSAGEDAQKIGEVTSGTQSPSLGLGIGLGYVPVEHARKETSIEIEIRGGGARAVVAAKPLYRKPTKD
jgi:aminomethyltransferase